MLNHKQISYWERKTFIDHVDFIIIGSGIVGYSCALHLRKKFPNAKILILEKGLLPSGASTKNAGFACFGSPTELWDDLRNYSEDAVWSTVEKRWKGLNYLKELIGVDALKYEQNGSWDIITDTDSEIYKETKQLLPYLNENIQKITGVETVYAEDKELQTQFGFNYTPTSFFNRLEGQIDTASMNKKFYQLVVANSIDILFGHQALSVKRSGDKTEVETPFGSIKCDSAFICTNGFANELLPQEAVQPARAQVLITNPIPGLKVKGTFHYEMGYYYFRNIDGRILLGGGRNLDFSGETTSEFATTDQIINRLKHLLETTILPDTDYTIAHTWSGIMGVGPSKSPIVKEIDKDIYCGVRMGGMGVAIGSLIGKELSELL